MPVLSPAPDDSGAPASSVHVRTVFELTVRAPYSVAFPLFGPDGERSWAEANWDPQFVYPSPAADVQGTVFTIKHGPHQAIWVNTAFDAEGHHIQYAYFISDVMVTTIDLTFVPLDSGSTKVSVVYERTALSLAANEQVQQFGFPSRSGVPDKRPSAFWKPQSNGALDSILQRSPTRSAGRRQRHPSGHATEHHRNTSRYGWGRSARNAGACPSAWW
jgi:hypothetical protein